MQLCAALTYVVLCRTNAIVPKLQMTKKSVQICHINFPENDQHKEIHNLLYQKASTSKNLPRSVWEKLLYVGM